MFITIKDILKASHTVINQSITMTEEQALDGGFASEVVCSAEINRLKYRVYVKVSYNCTLKRECSRCLNSFEDPVKGAISIVLQDKKVLKGSDEETFDYYFSETDKVVDIRQSLYEDVMVNLPIKPLCREDCTGITNYGINNSKTQGSKQDTIDPRWEVLKKLKKKSTNLFYYTKWSKCYGCTKKENLKNKARQTTLAFKNLSQKAGDMFSL